jgi:hypothetical protein
MMVRQTTQLPKKSAAADRDRLTLVSDFQPAGDQGSAIEGLLTGLNDGLARQTLLGVTGSGKTFTIGNVIDRSQRPTMILAPNKTLAAQLYGEMREFFPNNAVEYFVSYYDYYQPEAYVPSSDTFIEKDASVNEHIEQMRLSATKALIPRYTASVIRKPTSAWCCTLRAAIVSISARFFGAWQSFSTSATNWICHKVHTGCVVTLSTCSRPIPNATPFELSCLTRKSNRWLTLTR